MIYVGFLFVNFLEKYSPKGMHMTEMNAGAQRRRDAEKIENQISGHIKDAAIEVRLGA